VPAGFFAQLEALDRFADVVADAAYAPAPADWSLVITDVKGSTKAIEAGRYKDVNALGVASIVAVRNSIPDVDVPFVFGGDGATMLCPTEALSRVVPALQGLQRTSTEAFSLEMRAGVVPIAELREAGHEVRVARFRASEHANFAMFAGSGLTEGERWVKDPERGRKYAIEPGEGEADFSGFECRWQPIENRHGAVVSVLVQARGDREQAGATYSRVLAAIEQIIGREDEACPVAVETLKLAVQSAAFDIEARLLSGLPKGLGHRVKSLRAKALNQIGRVLLSRGWKAFGFPGGVYRSQVVANCDYRKFDDTLRMVLDLSDEQREKLEAMLAEEHAKGTIAYGTHVADSALMTCVVTQHEGDHVHFVDGADDGYALAAKQLKSQLKTPLSA